MDFVWWIAGYILGALVTAIGISIKSKFGAFRIDHSNPDRDKYLLDIGDLDKLSGKKFVILRVDHEADLSNFPQN